MWLLAILSSISICNGLFFEMTEKETKCFIEELPNDTILHGKYTTQLKEKDSDVYQKTAPGMGMHVEVKDPEKKVVLARDYGSEGRFTFTSHMPGEHTICIHSNSTKWSLMASEKMVHCNFLLHELILFLENPSRTSCWRRDEL